MIAGKGGTGKTTIAACLSFLLADMGYNVIALDTDSVPNLALSLGIPRDIAEKIVPLAQNEELVEERTGARPGSGWGVLFSLTPRVDDIADKYGIRVRDNLKLVVVGSIDASKQGCLCPAIALARHFLRHTLMSPRDIVVVDAEAGAEVFGRGLAEYFDFMFCICEPTVKSILIGMKLVRLARELNVKNNVIVVNKVRSVFDAERMCDKIVGDSIPWHIIRYDDNVVRAEMEGYGLDKIPRDSVIFLDLKTLIKRFMPWLIK